MLTDFDHNGPFQENAFAIFSDLNSVAAHRLVY